MFKNVASQKVIVFAFDSTTNLPKTGDAGNITAYVSKDYGTVTVLGDTSATEMDSTNAKGYYLFDLTQTETDADTLLFSAKSVTSNIVVVGAPATVFPVAVNVAPYPAVDVQKMKGSDYTALGTVDGYAIDEILKLMAAVLIGKQSGASLGTAVFRAADDSKDRVTATVSPTTGDRTAVSLDAT